MYPKNDGQARTELILDSQPHALEPHIESNGVLVTKTLRRANRGLLSRLFPGEHDNIVRDHALDQLKTGFQYRRRALEIAVDTRLQAVQAMCDHLLVTGRSELRRKRQTFIAEQMVELQRSMNACADRFHADLDHRFAALDDLPSEHLRTREEQRLLCAVDQFHELLEQLGEGFLELVRETVSGDRP